MAAKNARRDFGSFHASNVQELLEMSEEEYVPPLLPFKLPEFQLRREDYANSNENVAAEHPFGTKFKQKHFLLESDCTFLNHGAFGGVLKEALKVSQQWQEYVERQPLRFFDRELLPHLVYVTRRMASFVGCDPRDLVLVTNATTAINSVLCSLKFSPGDVIVCLNFTYGAVKKVLGQVCQDTGAQVREVSIQLPVTCSQQIIEAIGEAVKQKGVKLAVLDHIPSNVPLILPLKEIIPICHQYGVQVLVDGAHALGSLPLNLRSLDADFYVTNAHKWLCSPKGAALMYVRRSLQATVRPVVISHGYGSGFNSEFIWAGLHDYSPFLALHTILDFWESIGVAKFHQYAYGLARYAEEYFCKKWNTQPAAPDSMFGCMTLVELPSGIYPEGREVDYSVAETIQNALYTNFNIEVPVKAVQGRLYVRVSCHLHTDRQDIHKLGEAISQMALSSSSS